MLHSVPLGFWVSTNLRTFGKWAVSPASKRLLGIRAVCNLRLLGILKIWSICAGFGTFEDFDENLLWAQRLRAPSNNTHEPLHAIFMACWMIEARCRSLASLSTSYIRSESIQSPCPASSSAIMFWVYSLLAEVLGVLEVLEIRVSAVPK